MTFQSAPCVICRLMVFLEDDLIAFQVKSGGAIVTMSLGGQEPFQGVCCACVRCVRALAADLPPEVHSAASEEFSEACGYAMRFGKHQGRTLTQIGRDSAGLRYLDWVRGQFTDPRWSDMRQAIDVYLGHPDVSRRLDLALEKRR